MKAVFPGQPQATLHALSNASWNGNRIIAYISGNALIILGGHNELLQTISHEGNQLLTAVAISAESGKIATCTSSEIFVYKSYGDGAEDLRWFLQHSYTPSCGDESLYTLSWGEADELLLGGSHLTILSTLDVLRERWTKKLANKAKHAAFHYDASIIASTGWRDKLVKIWKRNFFGEDTERFDATYLAHPTVVTSLWWRGQSPGEGHVDPVLYTMCADNRLRVWTCLDPHGLQALQLWVDLDLSSCAQPPEPLSPSIPGNRYAAVIDNWNFKALIKKMSLSPTKNERGEYIRERLVEIATRDPEIVLVWDNDGNLSTWGLERVGSKIRHLHEVFNISHGKHLALQEHDFKRGQAFLQGQSFGSTFEDASVSLLLHSFHGRIECFESIVEQIFDPSAASDDIAIQAVWTGHSRPIEKLEVVVDGTESTVISHAAKETLQWNVTTERHGLSLRRNQPRLLPNGLNDTGTAARSVVNGEKILTAGFQPETHKKVIVGTDQNSFTIWDSRHDCLEYAHLFRKHETIQAVRWTLIDSCLPVLAIGLLSKTFIFLPLRFDYINGRQSWKCFREIGIRYLTTLPITDLVWLPKCDLLLAAGNQMFLYGPDAEDEDEAITDQQHANVDSQNMFDVIRYLNQLLPIFNSQLLFYYVLLGHSKMVHHILYTLQEKLKYYIEGEHLDSQLDFSVASSLSVILKRGEEDDANVSQLNEELAAILDDRLKSVQLPNLTREQQQKLKDVVACIGATERQLSSVDECGIVYLTLLEKHKLDAQKLGSKSGGLPWREVMWAYLSTSEEILLDVTARRYQGKMLWEDAKECGVFMWMTDLESLKTAFETIARNEYTKTDEKNPIDCSLYYIALRKKQVLQGLWRMATWNREQRATSRLLANNFDDPRWKTAALKNAYALMSLRRFQYAAAFFLLADHLKDAVSVLFNQAEDMQLAIAVARVYEGDAGPVLRELLQDKILLQAAAEGNRWLAAWAFCMLDQRHMALQALVRPLESIIEVQEPPSQKAKQFLNFDPALVTLYRIIRDDLQKSRKGAAQPAVSVKDESEFVLRNAGILCRMGCDVLALDLVRNWKFVHSPVSPQHTIASNPTTSTVEQAEIQHTDEEAEAQLRLDGLPKKRLVVTEEPSASSIFDNFNF